MARWRSGLTHMPFTHAFMGSNPVRVTKIMKLPPFIGLKKSQISGGFHFRFIVFAYLVFRTLRD